MEETGLGVSTKETLNKKELEVEFIFLKMRTLSGLSFSEYEMAFGEEFLKKYNTQTNSLAASGLIKQTSHGIFPTTKGLLFSDHLLKQLI